MKVFDLKDIEAWSATGGGPLLEPGDHFVHIDSIEEGTSSGNHPQLEIEFVSEGAPGAIRDWLVVIPSTYGKLRQLLDAVGIEPEGGEWDLPVAKLKGRKLWITVGEEPDFQDPSKTRRRVQSYSSTNLAGDMPADTRDFGPPPAAPDDEKLPF